MCQSLVYIDTYLSTRTVLVSSLSLTYNYTANNCISGVMYTYISFPYINSNNSLKTFIDPTNSPRVKEKENSELVDTMMEIMDFLHGTLAIYFHILISNAPDSCSL